MRWRRLLLFGVSAAALALPAPEATGQAAAPPGLEGLEGRGLGLPGAAAGPLGRAALRFAAPAGGAAELVIYLPGTPARSAGPEAARFALASLLGIPGEVALAGDGALLGESLAPSVDAGPEPVAEPASGLLGLLGLAALGLAGLARRRGSWHPAAPWSGPPRD
jgi:MYXO-CTERM domain-containing protein